MIISKEGIFFIIPVLIFIFIIYTIYKKGGFDKSFDPKVIKEINTILGTNYTKVSQLKQKDLIKLAKYRNRYKNKNKFHEYIIAKKKNEIHTSKIKESNIYEDDKKNQTHKYSTTKSGLFSYNKSGSIWDNRKSVLDEFKK